MPNKEDKKTTETDVSHKVIVPYLEGLGFKKSDMDFEFPVKAQIGSGKAKTVFADIVIRQKGKAVMIVEIKKLDHRLEERDREQAISYARLFDPEPVNFAVVTNGRIWQAYRVDTKERIPKIPSKDSMFKDVAKFKLTDDQREEANYFAVEGYKTVQDIETALRKCHDTLYSNDGLTPLQTFEEINKFLFSKIQEEKRVKKTGNQNRFTGKYLKLKKPKVEMQRIFEDAINDFPKDADKIFFEGDEIEVCNESILQVVKVLENKGFTETNIDIIGMAYETFLKPVFRNKYLGQYFTPREIVNFMIEFLRPEIGDLVIDPAFGSGGFLVEVFQTLKEKIAGSGLQEKIRKDYKKKLCTDWIFGTEIAPYLAKACKINMYIHGDGKTGVYKHDGLVDYGRIEENKFNLVLTNPPFGGVVNKKDLLDNFELGEGRVRQLKEVLFLERCVRLAKPGGKIGIVLPDGILTNSSLQYVRDYILRECKILGITSLPTHTFATSGAGVKTSIMFLEKKKKGEDYSNYNIFMSEVEHVGYDATGRPDDNDFSDILDRYYKFKVEKGEADENLFFLKNKNIEDRLDVHFYQLSNNNSFFKESKYKTVKIGDICYVRDGDHNKLLPEAISNKENGYRYLRVQDIKDGNILDDKPIYINKEYFDKIKRSHIKPGFFLFSIMASIGTSVVVPDDYKICTANRAVGILVPKDETVILSYYLYVLFSSEFGANLLECLKKGGVQKRVNLKDISEAKIPIPPLNIQKEIGKRFKKYQKNIANIRSRIEEIKKKSESFLGESLGFKALNPNNNQSFGLNVKNFGGARFDPNYYQDGYRDAENILQNSKYKLEKIDDVLSINKKLENMKDYEEINYIDLSCVDNELGEIVEFKKLKKDKMPSRARQKLEKGDLLVASLKGSLKNIVVFDHNIDNAIASTGFLLIKNNNSHNSIFLKALFQNSIVQKVIERRMTGAIMAAISQKEFKNIKIPIPPIEEQNIISKKIEKYEDEIIKLRNEIKKMKKRQSKILDIIF